MAVRVADALDLITRHGTDRYLAQAMEEAGVQYVDDATDLDFLLRRAEALREEDS